MSLIANGLTAGGAKGSVILNRLVSIPPSSNDGSLCSKLTRDWMYCTVCIQYPQLTVTKQPGCRACVLRW